MIASPDDGEVRFSKKGNMEMKNVQELPGFPPSCGWLFKHDFANKLPSGRQYLGNLGEKWTLRKSMSEVGS